MKVYEIDRDKLEELYQFDKIEETKIVVQDPYKKKVKKYNPHKEKMYVAKLRDQIN